MPDVIQIAIEAIDNASKVIGGVGSSLDKLSTDAERSSKNLSAFGMTTEQIGNKMTQAGKIATVGLTLPIAGLAVAATKAASDLNETANKIDTLFGNASGAIKEFSNTASTALGQSKKQALDAAADFAVFGKAAGLAGDDLVKFSKQNVTLAADMASFFNTSPEEAITAIGAAFRGESEPIRRYGVLINEASLKDEALRMGLIKTTTEALSPQARVLAAQALILKQTSAAQGDFAKTSDGLANQSRILNAQFQDVIATLGQSLLPVAVKVAGAANDLLKSFNSLDQPTKDLIVGFGLMAAAAGPVLTIGGQVVKVFGSLTSVFVDVAGGIVGASRTIGETAKYLKDAGASADSLKFAFENLKAGGVILGAELAVIAGGLVIVAKYMEQVGIASRASSSDLIAMSKSGDWLQQAAATTEIYWHGQERIKVALDGTRDSIEKNAKSYDDYKSSLEATAKAAGYQIDANGNLVKVIQLVDGVQTRLIQSNYELSASEYEANKALHAQGGLLDLGLQKLIALSREVDNLAVKQRTGAISSEDLARQMNAVNQGARNQAETYGVLDSAMDSSTAKANLLSASQKMIASDMNDLKTVMAGALKNENIQFGNKQDDLAAKAAKLREEINKLQASQGAAVSTTKKQGMTANETTLAQLQLAQAESQLAAQNTKVTMTAGDQAAAAQRLADAKDKLNAINEKETHSTRELEAAQGNLAKAQAELANNTDPLKQAELAVKVDNLREKLNGASGAVQGYVDNSAKIKELQGQYDAITKEVEANAEAHTRATRTIIFGYVEQTIAAQNARNGIMGVTQDQEKLLDGLAVRWGLKSKEDIAAMQAVRDAMAGFNKDGNLNEAIGKIDRSLGNASTIYEGAVQDINSVKNAHDNMAKALGVPLPDVKIPPPVVPPIDVKVTADNAHNVLRGVQEDADTTRKNVMQPVDYKVTTENAHIAIDSVTSSAHINPVDYKVTTENAHAAIAGVMGAAVTAQGTISTPAKMSIDKGTAEKDIKEVVNTVPVVIPLAIKPEIAAPASQEWFTKYAPKVDTAQATKDIQAFTTDVVGGVPKSKTTTLQTDTVGATKNTNDLLLLYGKIPPIVTTRTNVEAEEGMKTLAAVLKGINDLYNKVVTITVKYVTQGSPPAGLARGGSYIVPPNSTGATGDYFPVLAAPGERVTVETRSQQNSGKSSVAPSGDTYNYVTNVYNPLAAKMFTEEQRRKQLARSNARMGVA